MSGLVTQYIAYTVLFRTFTAHTRFKWSLWRQWPALFFKSTNIIYSMHVWALFKENKKTLHHWLPMWSPRSWTYCSLSMICPSLLPQIRDSKYRNTNTKVTKDASTYSLHRSHTDTEGEFDVLVFKKRLCGQFDLQSPENARYSSRPLLAVWNNTTRCNVLLGL